MDHAPGAPGSGVVPFCPDNMPGACKVFCLWGCNIPSSNSTQGRWLFSPSVPLRLPLLASPQAHTLALAWVQGWHTLLTTLIFSSLGFLQSRDWHSHVSYSLVHDLEIFFSCPNTIPQSTASLFSPFFLTMDPSLQYSCCFNYPSSHTCTSAHQASLSTCVDSPITLQIDFQVFWPPYNCVSGIKEIRNSYLTILTLSWYPLKHHNR